MAKTSDKVADAASTVKPYVDRALRDEQLRENVKSAYDSARSVYQELVGGRGVVPLATRVATDKEIQDELRSAVDELRRAADRVQGRGPEQEEHGGRNATLLLAGIALGILFNPVTGPQTRKFIADRLLGGGDDFSYESSHDNGAG